jgi:YfiH family protein
MIYRNFARSIYFGNAADHLYQQEYLALTDVSVKELVHHPLFKNMSRSMQLDSLVFLRQTHSILGYTITPQSLNSTHAFAHEGDFLITNMSSVGLGVMTADCLPIIARDNRTNAVGIAHAGWRGSVAGIAPAMLARMQQEYGTRPADVHIFFGPSARACCYQVQSDFLAHSAPQHRTDAVFVSRAEKLFFDVANYNRILLCELGVKEDSFNTDFNVCTICDESFFSFRRQGPNAGRQMTVVAVDK